MNTCWTVTKIFGCCIAVGAFVAAVAGGCSAPQEKPACSYQALSAIVAECTAKMASECNLDGGEVDENCPAVKACDQRIDNWRACP